ncbi:MAG: hypothetical protein HZB26_10770 [Candidatus Hydrogenedentes bacterium]|nr:hypothetical protein [Candidatus Hydrogenedentota bacterium]
MDTGKPTLYIVTTVPSYLPARDSTDVVLLGHQHITLEWWRLHLPMYEAFVSSLVHDEAGQGDPDAVAAYMELIAPSPVLEVTPEPLELAEVYIQKDAAARECWSGRPAFGRGHTRWNGLPGYLELPAHCPWFR